MFFSARERVTKRFCLQRTIYLTCKDKFLNFKVKKVTSSHSKGETVIISESPIGEDAVRSALDGTGYEVLSVAEEPYEKKGFFGKK